MTRHYVSISQLQSVSYSDDRPTAFLNVIEDAYGGIGVWGTCYSFPTYLLQDEQQFVLIQFSDQECADEWMKENADRYTVTRLQHNKSMNATA